MSCLDVMYHQSYGAHRYLPATSAAAVAYKAAYFHHQQQQQKRLCAYSKMQDSADPSAQGKQTQTTDQEERRNQQGMLVKEAQPAEAEYLSSRCVLFTYFQGEIGDVVDEHFSRALGQPSAFVGDAKGTKTPSGGLWREGGALSAGQCGGFPSSFWSSGYPSQGNPCLSSMHPDFSPTAAFHSSEPPTWAGHGLQPGLPPPPTVSDSWHYPLGAQSSTSYPHVHEVYPHVHPRHTHPRSHAHHMLHHAHGPTLDPRFSPLILPSVRPPCSPAPHCDAARSDIDTSSNPTHNWPASLHGSLDIYDSVLDQEKGKATVWF